MMVEEKTGESRDGQGAGDHDAPFSFGNWRMWLSPIQQARVTILRGYVRDANHTDFRVRYGDDSDYLTENDLYVPSTYEPVDS